MMSPMRPTAMPMIPPMAATSAISPKGGSRRQRAVGGAGQRPADERTVNGDAAGIDGEYVHGVVLELVQVLQNEEGAGADDAADDQGQGGGVDGVLNQTCPPRAVSGHTHAADHPHGGEHAVPGNLQAADLRDLRVDADLDHQRY